MREDPAEGQIFELGFEGKATVSQTEKRERQYTQPSQRQGSAGKVLEIIVTWLERKEQGGWGRR